MILVLEGTKRSGKTTWAEKVQWNFKNTYYFANRTLKDHEHANIAVYGYMVGILEFAKQLDTKESIIILDRFHITEYLYGKQRGYENSDMKFIDYELRKLNAIGILFYSNTWKERLEDPDNHFDKEVYRHEIAQSKMNWTLKTLDFNKGMVHNADVITDIYKLKRDYKV